MFYRLSAALAAAFFVAPSHQAIAAPVTSAIFLAVDGSGSISSSEFALQIQAYETLLGGLPSDGSIAVGAVQFASSNSVIYPLTVIDSAAAVTALTDSFATTSQLGGNTDIAGAIDYSAAELTSSTDFSCSEMDVTCLIDVSTDGFQTVSGDPDAAAIAAVASGVAQVNCLGVGSGANCGFIAGTDSFAILADSFDDFEMALATKLADEGILPPNPMPAVPLPAPVMLLGAGVMGLFGLRFGRRKA
ncbi:MAG: DUF1194 domain-containing protein [Mangrovicoccus sp.]|nr:DUF1194 domain-containing protein [Mangrovicoccus sp.]